MTAPRSTTTTAASRGASPSVVRQARGAKSRRGFFVALALVALAGLAIIASVLQRGSQSASAGPLVVPPAPPGAAAPVGYSMGRPAAPVEIIEYADFECSVCGQYFAVTEPDVRKQLVEPGLARYTLYDLQVNAAHANSPAASLAASCAAEQGQFWPMHDRLYGGQDEWNSQVTNDPRPVFAGYAKQLGLDMAKWNSCYDSRRGLQHLAVNHAAAERLGPGFRGTPTFVIGDRVMQSAATFDAIKAMVDSARTRAGATKPVAAR